MVRAVLLHAALSWTQLAVRHRGSRRDVDSGRLSQLDPTEARLPRDFGAFDLRRGVLFRPAQHHSGRDLFLPTHRPLRRFHYGFVRRLLPDRSDFVVLRNQQADQEHQGDDQQESIRLLPILLVHSIADVASGKIKTFNKFDVILI